MTSGDVVGIVGTVPEALRASVWQIGNAAFADGFAAAALLAAAVAAAMALFTVLLVRRAECVGGTTVSPNGPLSLPHFPRGMRMVGQSNAVVLTESNSSRDSSPEEGLPHCARDLAPWHHQRRLQSI